MQILRKTLLFDATRTISRFSSISRRLSAASDRAATGIAVERPSDAPQDWNQIHRVRAGLADAERWMRGIDRADEVYDAADTALDEAENVLARAIERAVQSASEALPSFDRTAMAGEVAGMRDDLLRLANTRVGERFVFAGDAYQAEAFDATATYAGATATQSVRVGDGIDAELAFDGQAVFVGAGGDPFQLLADFEAALTNDDAPAIQALLPQLEAARTHLVASRQDVGFRQAHVGDLRAVHENLQMALTTRQSALVAADPSEAYTELVTLQTSYEAALQVTASSSGTKLFDLLR